MTQINLERSHLLVIEEQLYFSIHLPAHFSEQDSGVCGRDNFVVNNPGLPEPLVRLRQGDVVPVVAPGHSELGKSHELVFETPRVSREAFQGLSSLKFGSATAATHLMVSASI